MNPARLLLRASTCKQAPVDPCKVLRDRLVAQVAEVQARSPARFSSFFGRERQQWAQVVARSGVKIH